MILFSDIDECSLVPRPCHGVCTNLEGSYTCSCTEGFKIRESNRYCEGKLNNCVTMICFHMLLTKLLDKDFVIRFNIYSHIHTYAEGSFTENANMFMFSTKQI